VAVEFAGEHSGFERSARDHARVGVTRRPAPALLVDQRRTDTGQWQALLATGNGTSGGVHVGWHEPGQVRPVTDDRADRQAPA
jgi:hypothetical protein